LVKIAGRERADLRWLVLAPATLVLVLWIARTMAFGGKSRYALIGLAVFVVVARPIKIFIDRRIGAGAMALELPVLLMLMSTLVWRERDATALSSNPLDSAAQIRILLVAFALLLGGFALISPARPAASPRARLTTLPFRVYLCYIAVVIIGIPFSVKPLFTSYRAVELVAGCVVLLGAYRALGNAAARRIEATIYWFVVALVASVWIGRFLDPTHAVLHPSDPSVPLKWELNGVHPTLAANTVGTMGALLAVWSLARFMNAKRYSGRRWVALVFALWGITTTIAAQYRTGYLAIVAGALVIFWFGQRAVFVVLVTVAVFVVLSSPSLITSAEPYVLRGQTTEEAQKLSGRIDYWSHAVPVWERSPIVGRGLWTASRYEVLAPLGFGNTSTLHSTWIEALVGTGLLGLTLLAGSVLITTQRAWRAARAGPLTRIGPLALLVFLLVRSFTGNLFESLDPLQLLFLAIALAIEDHRSRRPITEQAGLAAEYDTVPAAAAT
jgi:O-antigen ligase